MAAPMLGINPSELQLAADAVSPLPIRYRLGTVSGYDHPTYGYQEYVWGRAEGALTLGMLVAEATLHNWAPVTVTLTTPGTVGYGSRCAVVVKACADNDYVWLQIYGKGSLQTLLSAAKGTRLNSTATSGQVDDDAGSGSEAIFGLVLLAATDGSATLNADAVISYPTVGTTL